MIPGVLTMRKNQVVLDLLKRSLSRLSLHLQQSRKILMMIGGGKGGETTRGEGTERKSESMKNTLGERRKGTSMTVGMTRRTGRSAAAKISRRGGMILINGKQAATLSLLYLTCMFHDSVATLA
jgi:hypothetical protein